ncbi:uncharacterized protein V1518DRAFT_427411 [Limtongia smithiae]|uniref:uncharacterized protein n=1 Tax=Limtongia smithiae TaxID=1125753 RepID=UPI0034CF75DB
MDSLTDSQWRFLIALADTFVPVVSAQALISSVPEYTRSDEYNATITHFANESPSTIEAAFRTVVGTLLANASTAGLRGLRQILDTLDTRVGSLFLCGSTTPFTEMSPDMRAAVVDSWAHARLPIYHQIFHAFSTLCVCGYVRASELSSQAMRRPWREPHVDDPERYSDKDFYRFHMLSEAELLSSKFDVAIVGSGSGAGVVAKNLSMQGYSVLVVEKGKYYHQSELTFSEDEGQNNLYEKCGGLQSDDGSVLALAGSTLGGGSTINWSASLRTQSFVRREWAFKHGVKFYATKEFEDALDSVCTYMGVSADAIVHSRANQILLDGSKKIGSAVSVVPQNTNGATHQCGYCCYGCRFGEKQGGVVTWLVDAAKAGAKFLDQARVTRVLTDDHRATGVEIKAFGKVLEIPVKLVVVAAGSLNTPIVLQKSGFKNTHIGKHLAIHPVALAYGIFRDADFNASDEAILTVVNSECENVVGNGYGCKIECMSQQPLIYSCFPWGSGTEIKKNMLKFNNMAGFIALERDHGEGMVYADPVTGRSMFHYALAEADRKGISEGVIKCAEIMIAENAEEVYASDSRIPPLVVTPEMRDLGCLSPEFQAWSALVRKYIAQKHTGVIASAHQMSSCRMGSSPSTSATNPDGELWDCQNLFIADGSALPTASGCNPMITIMATAEIISKRIAQRLAELH